MITGPFLTDAEAGRLIRRSAATIRRWRTNEGLPFIPGRPPLIDCPPSARSGDIAVSAYAPRNFPDGWNLTEASRQRDASRRTSSVLDFGAADAPYSQRSCKPSLAGLCRIEVKYRNPMTLLSATKFSQERSCGEVRANRRPSASAREL